MQDTSLAWRYADTGGLVSEDPDRTCGSCSRANRSDGHDACLGALPHVRNACCGHGLDCDAYVQFDDGQRIEGEAAALYFKLRVHLRQDCGTAFVSK